MDRRDLLRLAGLAGLGGGLAGCGVASRDGLVIDGAGPSAGTAQPAFNTPPQERESQKDAKGLVDNFLKQAAGDPANAKGSLDRWRAYMTDEFRSSKRWTGSENRINVVWCDNPVETPQENGEVIVSYTMVPLGKLEKAGQFSQFSPASEPRRRVDFIVTRRRNQTARDDQVKSDTQSWYIRDIKNAPEGMLLSTNALAIYYYYRTLYFWDKQSRLLVPDGRYVLREWLWPEADREKKLLEWLLAGPALWLQPAVQPLPDSLSMTDLPAKVGQNSLAVNFTGLPADTDLARLVSQVTWTLLRECQALRGDHATSPIAIKVDSIEKKASGGPYLSDNATAVKVSNTSSLQAFAIDEGRIRRVKNNSNDGDRPVTLVSDDLNHGIEWAALHDDNGKGEPTHAALVVRDAKGKTAFLVIPKRGDKPVAVPKLAGKVMSQPTFVDGENLLMVVDGYLYTVRVGPTVRATNTRLPVRAFAVPTDGRRIAYISGGQLWVAALSRSSDNGLVFSGAHQLVTVLSDLSGVAFTAECWLAVSGTYGDKIRVVDMSLDGAMVGHPDHPPGTVNDIGSPTVTSLTASMDNPLGIGPARRIFITANGVGREVNPAFSPLADEVIGEPGGRSPVNAFFLQ